MRLNHHARSAVAQLRGYPDEQLVTFRAFASKVLHLHTICERPACRRARDCTGREAPCLFVYREVWDEVRPHLYKTLKEQVARQEAAGPEAEAEMQGARAEDRKVEPAFRKSPTRKQKTAEARKVDTAFRTDPTRKQGSDPTRKGKPFTTPRRSPRGSRSGRGDAR